MFTSIEIPEAFECPISHQIMVDPVSTVEGDTYDRLGIEEWLKDNLTNPSTGEDLSSNILITNKVLRSQIKEFVDKNKIAFINELVEALFSKNKEKSKLVLDLGVTIPWNSNEETYVACISNARKKFIEGIKNNDADCVQAFLDFGYPVDFWIKRAGLLCILLLFMGPTIF